MQRRDLFKKIEDILREDEELRLANPLVEEVTEPSPKAKCRKHRGQRLNSNFQEHHHLSNGKGARQTKGRGIGKGNMLHKENKENLCGGVGERRKRVHTTTE